MRSQNKNQRGANRARWPSPRGRRDSRPPVRSSGNAQRSSQHQKQSSPRSGRNESPQPKWSFIIGGIVALGLLGGGIVWVINSGLVSNLFIRRQER